MKIILVVGNIGSGKSTSAKMLASSLQDCGYKTELVDLDKLGHEVIYDEDIQQDIAGAFDIDFPEDATKNSEKIKKTLIKTAFSSPENTKKLNQIMHPAIYSKLESLLQVVRNNNTEFVIVEASAISDKNSKFVQLAEEVVCVVSDEKTRQERVKAKGLPKREFKKRNAVQLSEKELAGFSGYVIINNGTEQDLLEQVGQVAKELAG